MSKMESFKAIIKGWSYKALHLRCLQRSCLRLWPALYFTCFAYSSFSITSFYHALIIFDFGEFFLKRKPSKQIFLSYKFWWSFQIKRYWLSIICHLCLTVQHSSFNIHLCSRVQHSSLMTAMAIIYYCLHYIFFKKTSNVSSSYTGNIYHSGFVVSWRSFKFKNLI